MSTSSAADTPANHSPSPVSDRESPTPVTFGRTSTQPFATYDPDTQSWKTYPAISLWGSDEYSETWPKSGTTRNGAAFQRPQSVHLTSDTESSPLLPTPVAKDDGKTAEAHLAMKARMPGGPRKTTTSLAVMARSGRWPTPTVADSRGTRKFNGEGELYSEGNSVTPTLNDAVRRWPTPTVDDANNVTRSSGAYQSLTRAVQSWRTPKASDAAHSGRSTPPKPGQTLSLDMQVNSHEETPGQLNPTWVEWLMGFPLGWTDLDASATPSSPKSPNGSATKS
jgi:hypothetical protein